MEVQIEKVGFASLEEIVSKRYADGWRLAGIVPYNEITKCIWERVEPLTKQASPHQMVMIGEPGFGKCRCEHPAPYIGSTKCKTCGKEIEQ